MGVGVRFSIIRLRGFRLFGLWSGSGCFFGVFVHYFVNRYLVAGRHLNQFSGVFFLLFEIYTCPFTGGAGRMP